MSPLIGGSDVSAEVGEVNNKLKEVEENVVSLEKQLLSDALPMSSNTYKHSHTASSVAHILGESSTVSKASTGFQDSKNLELKPLIEHTEDEVLSQKYGGHLAATMRKFFRKPITKIQENAFCLMFFGKTALFIAVALTLVGVSTSIRIAKLLKAHNSTLVLTHNRTESTTLSNIQAITNLTVKTDNNKRTVRSATKLTQTTPTALPAVIKKTIKNKIVEHNHMHIEHTHTSNAQLTVYIVAGTVATLLLIAVCILALQITKTNKQDVCTDMQYYTCGTTGASTAMQSNMNTLLH